MDEITKALLEVAKQLQLNAAKEADASKGYIEQKAAIANALTLVSDEETKMLLKALDEATDEKISDELNHNVSLIEEFTLLTGIQPATD